MARGSPPGIWGKVYKTSSSLLAIRFTPRHLGKGLTASQAAHRFRFTPSASGERRYGWDMSGASNGSPPGIWGKEEPAEGDRHARRFTPRHLGKAGGGRRGEPGARFTPRHLGKGARWASPARATSVHPQASGERLIAPNVHPPFPGSPPGIWGKVCPVGLGLLVERFTPRHLGKGLLRSTVPKNSGSPPGIWGKDDSRASGHHRRNQPVHPQASGERGKGPSPDAVGNGRFTPRHLGKGPWTRWQAFSGSWGKVHGAATAWATPTVHPQASGER